VRLAIVVPTFPTRVTSAEFGLAQGLAERGHEVVVFSSGREGARKDRSWSSGGSPEPPRPSNFRVAEIPTLAIGYAEGSIPLRLGPIFSGRPDAVLLQEDYPPLSQIVAGAARRRSIPYVVTSERYSVQGPWVARSTIRALDRWVLPRLWRHSRALTVHSTASREFFLTRNAPADRLHFVPASTDVRYFAPGPSAGQPSVDRLWPARDSRVRLLTAARLSPAKGLDTLLDATQHLTAGGVGVVSLVRGRGELDSHLGQRLTALGLSQQLRIDGSPLAQSDVPSLYRSADVYVQPSLTEPFGMATLEAMACGLPVVASATGGLADLVEHGVTGLLVPPGEPTKLSVALRTLVEDPTLRVRMGRASRDRAESMFGMQPVAKSFEELLTTARA
jgi:glycosyltransferase involved in cell wall biosynthesis